MPYAIELYFDDAADVAVRRIWRSITQAGFKSPMLDAGYQPHVSLGVYDNDALNLDDLRQTLFTYAGTLAPFSLDLSNIGIFPTAEGVLFLGATVTQKLQWIHAGFQAVFESYAGELRPYYRVGHWVPHCTLSYGLKAAEIAAILPLCRQTPLPLRALVQKIGIAKVSPLSCEFIIQLDLNIPGKS